MVALSESYHRSICGRGYGCLFSCHHWPLGLTRTKSFEFRSYLQIPAIAKCIIEKGSTEQSSYGHIIDDILHHSSQLSFRVIDTPTYGRKLLEALKDVEDHFIRAYDSGLEVSRMLEANRVPMLSGLEEIKGICNHAFHFHCISRGLKTHQVCPLVLKVIRQIEKCTRLQELSQVYYAPIGPLE